MKLFNLETGTETTVNDGVGAVMLSRGGYRPSLPLPGNEPPAKPAGLPAGLPAERLYRKAAELEAKLPALRDAVKIAEGALAGAYAEDGDPSAAGRRLSEARDGLTAAVAALGQLERDAFERARMERRFGEGMVIYDLTREFHVSMPRIREGIANALPKELVSFADVLADQAATAWWTILQEKAASKFVALTKVPAEPRPRDTQGFLMNDAQVAEANDRRNRLGTTA